jgi:hypothetical protein
MHKRHVTTFTNEYQNADISEPYTWKTPLLCSLLADFCPSTVVFQLDDNYFYFKIFSCLENDYILNRAIR